MPHASHTGALAGAADLVARTCVAKLLAGYRDRPRADHDAIYGVLALDARIGVAPAKSKGNERFAIRPYPRELEETVKWNGRPLLLRPILPEDEVQHLRFLKKLDADDVRMRLFYAKREIAHSALARLTQIDYEREMAFIATTFDAHGEAETLGVVRAITDPDNVQTEMAIIVRSDLKSGGLGRLLLDKMIRYCRERGTTEMTATALHANQRMLALAKSMGFASSSSPDGVLALRLALQVQR